MHVDTFTPHCSHFLPQGGGSASLVGQVSVPCLYHCFIPSSPHLTLPSHLQTLSAPTPTLKMQPPGGLSLVDSPQVLPPTPPIKPSSIPSSLSFKLTVPSSLTPAKLSSPSLTILEGHTPNEGMMLGEGVVSPTHQLKKHKSEHKHKKKHKHKEDRHGDQKGEEHRRKHKHKHSKGMTSSQGEL